MSNGQFLTDVSEGISGSTLMLRSMYRSEGRYSLLTATGTTTVTTSPGTPFGDSAPTSIKTSAFASLGITLISVLGFSSSTGMPSSARTGSIIAHSIARHMARLPSVERIFLIFMCFIFSVLSSGLNGI